MATMAAFDNNTNSKSELSLKDSASVPSGFVLKLYQMVNEAPDEIITWLPSGDAFRISNLQRLENETLPTFFRHRRFQSLVRQLNFYNFRKVNRERTFWVYRHQLFHRGRPEELHLLRRRTCPGVDGRKQRTDNSDLSSTRSYSPRPTNRRSPYPGADDQSDESVALSSKKNKRKVTPSDDLGTKKHRRKLDSDSEREEMDSDEEVCHDNSTKFHVQESPSSVININLLPHVVPDESDEDKGPSGIPKRMVSPNLFGDGEKRDRSNSFEHSVLISKVARKLDAHAKRAAAAKGISAARKNGIITPSFSSDTMKYHALTYDDEIEIYDSERGCVVERQQKATLSNDSDEQLSIISNDDEDISFEAGDENLSAPPVENRTIVSDIVRKLHGWARQSTFASKVDGQLAAAIAGFCMMTNPRDVCFEDKGIELLFGCGSLVTEFRRYKSALLPGSLPTESSSPKKNSRLDVQIKQLFSDDKPSTIRAFKVFLLNSLEDLVNDTSLMTNVGLKDAEADCMNGCYQIWLSCLRHSSA